MPFLAGLGGMALSLLRKLATEWLLKRLLINLLEAEAKRYKARAEKTAGKEDDARAAFFLKTVEDMRKAWEL